MIVRPAIDYLAIAPEIVMMGASMLLLLAMAMTRGRLDWRAGTVVSVLAGLASLVLVVFQWDKVATHGASTTIAHAVALDGFSVVAVGVIALGVVLSALVANDWMQRERAAGVEYHVLALAAASGAMIMAQANDLIVIFLGLEILSLGLYVLVAFDRSRATSSEAALKYFLLGGLASAIFVYGAALTYGATGSTSLTSIATFLGSSVLLHPGVLLAGMGLLIVGFAFKIAAVPFHLWSPDVYEGAPTPVTGYMAVIVKVGAFAAFLRVLASSLGTQLTAWRPIIGVIAVLTMFLGASLAIVQRNVKRLLAYSSINQAGFMLLGLWAGTAQGVAGTMYYLITYTPVVIASFAVVMLVGGPGDEGHAIERYRGLARRQPWLGGAFTLLLLAQAGAPFTTGFFAKYSVVAAAIAAGGTALGVLAMIAAAIAAYFYLRLAVSMYADDAGDEAKVAVPWPTGSVIGFASVTAVVFGVWVGPLASLAHQASLLFLP